MPSSGPRRCSGPPTTPSGSIWFGEAHLLAGDGDAGAALGARALELARRHGERGHEAYGLRLLGRLASGARRISSRRAQYYREALALAKTLGMQPLAAALASCLP